MTTRPPTPADIRQEIADGYLHLLECPTCGAAAGQPCRSPSGRKRENIHDTRPFTLGKVGK